VKHRLSLHSLLFNWRLKLAALGLAVLIWAAVSAEQVTSQWIPVRIDPVVRDPEFVLTGAPDPAEVRVRFSGPGRELWELALDRPSLVLPLADIGNRRAFALDASMLRIPSGLSVNVQDIRPAVVRVDVQRLASRVLPVRARLGARSSQRYVLVRDLEVLPAEVRVTGPADRLAAMDSVSTRGFEIFPDDSTFSQEVALDTAGMEGLSFSRNRVRVSGPVDVRGERPIGSVAVSVPEGTMATPGAVQVSVTGAERVVGRVFAGGVRAYVPRDSLPAVLPPQGVDAPLVFDGLPPGARGRANPARVRVQPRSAAPPAGTDSAPAPGPRP
jgi:YbbR domain-containing protein